jgi:hypothetical protein
LVSVAHGGETTAIDAPVVTVHLGRAAARLVLTIRRYANAPTARPPGEDPRYVAILLADCS